MVYELSKTLGMPLGSILEEAALVSHAQLQVALYDQMSNNHLLIGEILALRGWIKQETADFFVLSFPHLIKEADKKPLGEYLEKAYLLNHQQINAILEEQKQSFIRFGALAVLKGYLKQETVDFFLHNFFPERQKDTFFMKKDTESNLVQPTINYEQPMAIESETETKYNLEFVAQEESFDSDDVHWVD